MKRLLGMALTFVLALGGIAGACAEGEYISVISKGEQHAFWQAVKQGCADAALDYGVDMHYYGTPSEADVALQVAEFRSELEKNPAAVAFAALDTTSVNLELAECVEKGIPVIGFDSGVPNAPAGAIYATASTNNQAAAAIAADELMRLDSLGKRLAAATADEPAVIAVLTQDTTSESLTDRTTGFVDRMKALTSEIGTVSVTGEADWADVVEGASIVIHVQTGETAADRDLEAAAANVLGMQNLCAVFCSNEGTAKGLLAMTSEGAELGEGGRYEDVTVAGFDAGTKQKNAVRMGWFVGSVTQDPYMIGYYAIELAAKAVRGEPVSDVDTGAHWYTAANIDDPEIALLVYD